MKLRVRELEKHDLPPLLDYWYQSPHEHLISMGVDLMKLPSREVFENMLLKQLELPAAMRNSFALIWELEGEAVGHSNINQIKFGISANMHLHLWKPELRKTGLGSRFVKRSLPVFFDKMNLEFLICEPYTHNPAPNKTLEKLGFTFVKTYLTIPGSINFEQEVNQWKIEKIDIRLL